MTLINYALLLVMLVSGCKKQSGPAVPPAEQKVYYPWTKFVMGADLSYVNAIEEHGGKYLDSGTVRDPFLLFRNHGTNLVRVRLWHDPQWQVPLNGGKVYSNLDDVAKTIQRARDAGMAVNLDLHYSDIWADPGKQETPEAWRNLSLPRLKDSVYRYTMEVLQFLAARNLVPEMIQVGNETNSGMLFPAGKVVNNDWTSFAALLQSGIKAVRDYSATSVIKPRIILHVAQLQNADWWANGVINLGGVSDFDVLGISHYFLWSTVSAMPDISSTIRNLKNKYGKEVMIVETACPWTAANADSYNNIIAGTTGPAGYGVSHEEQLRYMKDLTQAVITGGGSGIMYWEPEWISSSFRDLWGTGSSWENNTFFDFSGNLLPGIDYMNTTYSF